MGLQWVFSHYPHGESGQMCFEKLIESFQLEAAQHDLQFKDCSAAGLNSMENGNNRIALG